MDIVSNLVFQSSDFLYLWKELSLTDKIRNICFVELQ